MALELEIEVLGLQFRQRTLQHLAYFAEVFQAIMKNLIVLTRISLLPRISQQGVIGSEQF